MGPSPRDPALQATAHGARVLATKLRSGLLVVEQMECEREYLGVQTKVPLGYLIDSQPRTDNDVVGISGQQRNALISL